MVRKFEFKKTYEEIEIGEKVYRVDFSDDSLKRYQNTFIEFKKEFEDTMTVDTENLDEKQALEHYDRIVSLCEGAVETFIGKGTFEEIYEASGRSITNIYDFIWYLAEIISERSQGIKKEREEKYLRNKQK